MSILIQKVQVDGKTVDIAVRGNRIAEIRPGIEGEFDQVIDGSGCAALPPFYNTHCHAAMTLLRGIADDMELFDWLSNHIWPAEAKLTPEDIYWGTRLACLERHVFSAGGNDPRRRGCGDPCGGRDDRAGRQSGRQRCVSAGQ